MIVENSHFFCDCGAVAPTAAEEWTFVGCGEFRPHPSPCAACGEVMEDPLRFCRDGSYTHTACSGPVGAGAGMTVIDFTGARKG